MSSAAVRIPPRPTLAKLRAAAAGCRACDLWEQPGAREIAACRPWLDAEIDLVKPKVLVCLGATAAQALLGRSFRVSQQRGRFVPSPLAPLVTATVHPSSILRARDEETRRTEMARLVEDLRAVARAL